MDLASVIVLGAVYVGYNMSQKDRPVPKKEGDISDTEKPNGRNIYYSDNTKKVDSDIKKIGGTAFEGAKDTKTTNWVSPFFNQNIFGNDCCNDVRSNGDSSILPNVRKLSESELKSKQNIKQKEYELNQSQFTSGQNFKLDESLNLLATQETSKLTGEPLDLAHNNMVPFFGPKMYQNLDPNRNATLIEKFTGKEDVPVRKQEVPYMFDPEKNRGNVFGSEVYTSRIDRSRIAQSNKKHNILPMPQIKEAYLPSEVVRPEYKNVDNLRIKSNPKLEYKARRIDGIQQSKTQRGVVGEVNKNRPDRFYINSEDRYFTGPSHIKKHSHQGVWTRKDCNKSNIAESQENFGPATAIIKSEMPRYKAEGSDEFALRGSDLDSIVRNPLKESFKNDYTRNISGHKDVDDYGLCSYSAPIQERESTSKLHVLNVAQPSQGEYIGYEDTSLGIENKPKTTNKEINLYERKGNANSYISEPMDYREYYNNQRYKQELDNLNYIGNASGHLDQRSRNDYDSHRIKTHREQTVDKNNYISGKHRSNIPVDVSDIEICKRNEKIFDSARPYGNGVVPKYTDVTQVKQCGDNTKKQCQTIYKDPEFQRISSDLLSAFKSNPYTQSLNSI